MPSSKLVERDEPVVVTNTATLPQRTSRLPRKLRFPILLALNFWVNGALWSVAENFIPPELGSVTKIEDDSVRLFAHLAYRIGFLYFTWRANYDWIDVGALTVLTTAPYAYLLTTYYEVSTLTVALLANIEVLSIVFPTFLLRGRSPIHNPKAGLRNRFLLESFQVQTSTALLAVGVYVVVLWSAVKTGFLNIFLVSHFDIPTLEAAHNETPLSLIAKVASSGIAARTFLLNPSMGAQTGTVTPREPFDPATATLSETIRYNFWFFSKRTRTLIKQTAVITAFMFANTVQRTLTIRDSDVTGAAGYASLWVLATWITAAWWVWVGDTEDED